MNDYGMSGLMMLASVAAMSKIRRRRATNGAAKDRKTFYRVNHHVTGQGLWYDSDGNFTGLIHGELSFCTNTGLAMDFDPELVGYVSVVETLDQLYQWFTRADILKLQERGWFAYEYESDDYRWYERFGHYVARQSSLVSGRKIVHEKTEVAAIEKAQAKRERKAAKRLAQVRAGGGAAL